MPDAERAKLRSIVRTAHRAGRRVRFWGTPDRPGRCREALWQALLDADVDLINTDDLEGLRSFLSERDVKGRDAGGAVRIYSIMCLKVNVNPAQRCMSLFITGQAWVDRRSGSGRKELEPEKRAATSG